MRPIYKKTNVASQANGGSGDKDRGRVPARFPNRSGPKERTRNLGHQAKCRLERATSPGGEAA